MAVGVPIIRVAPEIASRAALQEHQFARLKVLAREVVPRNPFWRARFAESGLVPDQIASIADLARLPLTTKAEISADQSQHPPWGSNLTFDLTTYNRLHQTSGTTGAPIRWLDTRETWLWILGCWKQLFSLMELTPHDRLFFSFSFGPFLGFWAGFEGASRLGHFCLPAGGMSSRSRLELLIDSRSTVLCCTPTYALRLADEAREARIDLASSAVRAVLVAGEPGGSVPATRRRIAQAWNSRVVDHWGMTELGPLAIEAPHAQGGLTLLETECIAEIVDPATGQPVAEGEEGELVVTNLGRTGSPLFRYRTGDRVVGRHCGDSQLLFLEGGILGRTDEMLTIRGNNVYPSAIENLVREFAEVVEFRVELATLRQMDSITITVEPAAGLAESDVAALVSRVAAAVQARFHFAPQVKAAAVGALPRFEMKARRFVRATGAPGNP